MGEKDLYLGGQIVRLPLRAINLVDIKDEEVSPFAFVKFEIIRPLLCFLFTLLQISTAGHGIL